MIFQNASLLNGVDGASLFQLFRSHLSELQIFWLLLFHCILLLFYFICYLIFIFWTKQSITPPPLFHPPSQKWRFILLDSINIFHSCALFFCTHDQDYDLESRQCYQVSLWPFKGTKGQDLHNSGQSYAIELIVTFFLELNTNRSNAVHS